MIEVGKVGMVPIFNVKIADDRAREQMGDLELLRDSMKESGLISPLAVKDNHDGTYTLLAGERRFTVLISEGVLEIPARIYDKELSELEMKVIEKAENFYRKDFEWFELDKLTMEIHRMQQELYGVKAPGPNTEGWGTRDTAEMIGQKSAGAVTQAIQRAEAREAFPELFENCKSASDASKILKKIDEAAVKQEIAKRIEAQTADLSLQKLSQSFIISDFFEGVAKIPDGVFHLVEIDPPYAIRLLDQKRKDGESQYQLENYNEIDVDKYPDFLDKLFTNCFRVMATHSWLVCWFAPHPWFEIVYQSIRKAGFETNRMPGIWTKGIPGQNMNPTQRLSNSYEMFFYAWKGQPTLNKPGHGNVFHFSPVPSNQKCHPTERPIELMKEVYETFAFTGSRVLIPFLGSGNGILAATQLGMSALGFELSKGYKDSFLVKANLMKQNV